jgi:LL-diaminopimelate aminotransferase
VYASATLLAGGDAHEMILTRENNWFPDLTTIPESILNRATVMWLNYPNNPTGAIATAKMFQQAVDTASRYRIAVCHDAAYAMMGFDGYRPISYLQVDGAREVGVEINSFSKTYNMAGWRVGMAVGNRHIIGALREVKSNIDAGLPLPIQHMAIVALQGNQRIIDDSIFIYQTRRNKLVATLNEIGLDTNKPQAGLYLWARVPSGWDDKSLAAFLLDQKAILVTPGSSYGSGGDGYVRLSLTVPDRQLDHAVERLKGWHIPQRTA